MSSTGTLLVCAGVYGGDDKPLPLWLGRALLGIAQRLAERRNARVLHELLRIDDQQSDLLAFTGRAE